MIIYVNYNKQTGQISVDNDIYPNDPTILLVTNESIVNSEDNINFEIAFDVSKFQELEPPLYPDLNEEI